MELLRGTYGLHEHVSQPHVTVVDFVVEIYDDDLGPTSKSLNYDNKSM